MADTIFDDDDDDDLAEKRSLLTGALRTLLLFSVVLIGVSTAPATAALFAVVVVVVVVVVIFWGVRLAISRYISAERPQNSSLPVRLFTLHLLSALISALRSIYTSCRRLFCHPHRSNNILLALHLPPHHPFEMHLAMSSSFGGKAALLAIIASSTTTTTILAAETETSYGVDVSFPQHHRRVVVPGIGSGDGDGDGDGDASSSSSPPLLLLPAGRISTTPSWRVAATTTITTRATRTRTTGSP